MKMQDAIQALKLIPDVWNTLKEQQLFQSAEKVRDELNGLIGEIRLSLKEVYKTEVIDNDHKECIKTLRKLLCISEDAIDDLLRPEPRGNWGRLASYVPLPYYNRTPATIAKDVKKGLEDYKKKKKKLPPREFTHELPSNDAQSSSAGHWPSSVAYSEETDDALVGIDKPRDELVELLTKEDLTSRMIFVHGTQGVGKTSLVGAVLRNEKVKHRFKYCVWIEDLRSCELVKDRAAKAKMWDLNTRKREDQGNWTLREAFNFMKAKNSSWVLVLDDAGIADVLKSLRDELIETRPSVLITTQVSSLASSCIISLDPPRPQSGGAQSTGDPPIILSGLYFCYDVKHDFLSKNDSRTLFRRMMLKNGTDIDDSKGASDLILRRCRKLPLVILATCRYLQQDKIPDVDWDSLSGRLEEKLLAKGGTDGPIGRTITLRKEHLLDIRDCLFYLSIFPLDCPTRCSTMMRLWMAERFIKQQGTQLVQEKAQATLVKLLEHNVIRKKEKTSYERVRTCCVDNLLHQIIISESKDEEFAMIVANSEEQLPDNVWHLSFHCNIERDYEGTWVERLRSLLVFKKVYPESMKKLLEQAKRLKVLDLQRHLTKEEENYFPASLSFFPEEILRSKYLRYLSLRDTKVEIIPHGIGGLPYLETLDLKGTPVSELPDDILELKALRHLLVYRSNRSPAAGIDPKHGVKAPSAMGGLTSLQKLCMIELNPVERTAKHWERKELLKELGKLANLRRLGISKLTNEDVGFFCASIEELTSLEALHIIAATGEVINLSKEYKRKAPKCLRRVHLTGCLGNLPNWILSPNSLVKLVLKRSQLTEDPLQHLGKLRCLKHLELQQAFDVPEMKFKTGWFRQLCFLGLDIFKSLKCIKVDEEALPALEILSLARCKSLKTVPQDITRPKKLKYLELYGMPRKFNKAVKRNEELREHIKVKFKEWKEGALEVVIMLPARHKGSPSVPPPCMK